LPEEFKPIVEPSFIVLPTVVCVKCNNLGVFEVKLARCKSLTGDVVPIPK